MTKKSINKLVKQDRIAVRKACKLQHEKEKTITGKECAFFTAEDALIKVFNNKTMKKIALMECVEAKTSENDIGQFKVELIFSNDKCVKKFEKKIQMLESEMSLTLSGLKDKVKSLGKTMKVGHA